MDDASMPRGLETDAQPESSHSTPRKDYEPPTMKLMGPLTKMTLGSGGNKNDGINKLKQ
jgi:hypothetical protein